MDALSRRSPLHCFYSHPELICVQMGLTSDELEKQCSGVLHQESLSASYLNSNGYLQVKILKIILLGPHWNHFFFQLVS